MPFAAKLLESHPAKVAELKRGSSGEDADGNNRAGGRGFSFLWVLQVTERGVRADLPWSKATRMLEVMRTTPSLETRLLAGAGAGIAATAGIYGLQAATGKWLPEAMPPIRQDPAEFMLERAGSAVPSKLGDRIHETAERGAGSLLHFGYGTTAAPDLCHAPGGRSVCAA